MTETEGKLLSYISEWGKKVVMVLNKVDLFEDAESQRKVTAFVEENGSRILGATPPVFGVAGRLALNSKLKRAAGDTAALPSDFNESSARRSQPSALDGGACAVTRPSLEQLHSSPSHLA